jgi:hypothetical protein
MQKKYFPSIHKETADRTGPPILDQGFRLRRGPNFLGDDGFGTGGDFSLLSL